MDKDGARTGAPRLDDRGPQAARLRAWYSSTIQAFTRRESLSEPSLERRKSKYLRSLPAPNARAGNVT